MFNENKEEYSKKKGKRVPVKMTNRYTQSKKKALEIIEKYDSIEEADFWILMNEGESDMYYSGLIMSHNGCLKLNDCLEFKLRFKPSCMTLDKDGYGESLVYTYINDEQGIYEIGEVSKGNCKNPYPYAMALKRCFDRVVLKNSRLGYSGVYSESEADDFKEPLNNLKEEPKEEKPKQTKKKAEPKKAEPKVETPAKPTMQMTPEPIPTEPVVDPRLASRDRMLGVAYRLGYKAKDVAQMFNLNPTTPKERFDEIYEGLMLEWEERNEAR